MEDYNPNNIYPDYNSGNNQQFGSIPEKKPQWAGITSFVLSIVTVITCCCTTYVTAVLSLIFGIISLAKKWGAKGLAIAGVVISSITLVFTITVNTAFAGVSRDIQKFAVNADAYISEYDRTGEVPDDFAKYNDEKYQWYFNAMGYDSFDGFYGDFIRGFKSTYNKNNSSGSDSDYNNSNQNDSFGENPVDI
ncbi:MAG: DUF4190 domain-containing protein [Ruminococcus sp.]|nr:DUF4190 domain-containing protein [Ruminococcus sp.]MDE7226023.1 DUF4190 domain-containing protein [Ruminococcus sp.]